MIPAHIRSLALTVPWLQRLRNISFYKKIQLQQRKGQWQDWNNIEEDISDNEEDISVSDNINDGRNEQGENEVQERRYPERDRRPINRYGQNIYE